MRLTDIVIKHLPAPGAGQKAYADDAIPGFSVRVSQGGAKTFCLVSGATRERVTIGRYPILGLAEARQEAKRLLAERTLGKHRPVRMPFEDAIAIFVAEKTQKNRARTIVENERILRKYFVPLHRRNLADLTAPDLTRILDKLSDTPGTALHAFWTLRTFLRWCYKRGYIERNPIERLDPPSKTIFRERVLSDDELTKVWAAAQSIGYPFGTIVQLLLLTGQRRSGIGSLRADYLQPTTPSVLPSDLTKNRRSHTFPVGPLGAQVLATVPSATSARRSRHPRGSTETSFSGWSRAFSALHAQGEHRARGSARHDLRRTFATGLQRLGVKIEVIEALLNHISGTRAGIVGVYQRYHYQDEMRDAVERWEQHLGTILKARNDEELTAAVPHP